MLVYKDTKASERRNPPPWMEGAHDLQERNERGTDSVRWWGIGNPHLVGDRRDWFTLDDGWKVSVAGPVNPQEFRRVMRWCRTVDVECTNGRKWTAPVILNEKGNRVILVSYGKDLLPALTAAQSRAFEIATAAREHLESAQEVEDGGLDMEVAVRWAVELLALTHHISMEAIAVLELMDEALILSVLAAATGLSLKKDDK